MQSHASASAEQSCTGKQGAPPVVMGLGQGLFGDCFSTGILGDSPVMGASGVRKGQCGKLDHQGLQVMSTGIICLGDTGHFACCNRAAALRILKELSKYWRCACSSTTAFHSALQTELARVRLPSALHKTLHHEVFVIGSECKHTDSASPVETTGSCCHHALEGACCCPCQAVCQRQL